MDSLELSNDSSTALTDFVENPWVHAGLVFGKCILFAGIAFITYRWASGAAWEAGGEAAGIWSRVMFSNGDTPIAEVLGSGAKA